MTRPFFTSMLVWAIEIAARLSTPFCARRCKALFWRRDFCCGLDVSKKGFPAALIIWLAVGVEPALAAPQCDQRGNVLRGFAEKYREAPVALGVTSGGNLIEVLATGDGATWSLIITDPQGLTCLVASGEGWRTSIAVLPGSES
jgi:hypothetical protein